MKGGGKKSEKNFLNMKQLIYGETFGCYTEKNLLAPLGKLFAFFCECFIVKNIQSRPWKGTVFC
jgi:hypothetical protein